MQGYSLRRFTFGLIDVRVTFFGQSVKKNYKKCQKTHSFLGPKIKIPTHTKVSSICWQHFLCVRILILSLRKKMSFFLHFSSFEAEVENSSKVFQGTENMAPHH